MILTFCGAARTVTGSCHLLELDDGYKILLDCGLYQGDEEHFSKFNEKWFFSPSSIDCVVLSHAHIDHSGRIPKLVKDGFEGEVICTGATRDLSTVLLLDSAKIQEKDAYYMNKELTRKGEKGKVKPLYTTHDVYLALNRFVGVGYDTWHSVNERVSILFRDAGHIFGSANVTVKVKRRGKEDINIGFTGDIGRPGRLIVRDPVPMSDLDYLICESTYGGQKHEDVTTAEKHLFEVIVDTCVKRKGKLLIPAFSVGRTQELVYILNRFENQGLLPDIPVYVDSPLAINATEVFRIHPECFDEEILEYMIEDPHPFGFDNLNYVRSIEESKKINRLKGPAIIISGSGMINGGRILHHLIHHGEDERNTLLIVGYCAEGTLGHRIRKGERRLEIYNTTVNLRANVVIMDSFSAHADHYEIMEYLSNIDKERLKGVFLVHGEPEKQKLLQDGLFEEGFKEVHIPVLGERFELE